MALTTQQLTLLKQDIATHPALASLPQTADNAFAIAAFYNQPASPDFFVWRTSLGEQEIYEATSPAQSTWNWATYKAQSIQDRDCWTRMMNPGVINPSLAQTRAGWNTIFGTQGASLAQVNFLLSLGSRRSTAAEALFSTGTGSAASPATMGYEGTISYTDVQQAWELP
jgi:hypothetical protein